MSAYCSKCGSENQDDARFCFQCGARFVELDTSQFGGDSASNNPDSPDSGRDVSPRPSSADTQKVERGMPVEDWRSANSQYDSDRDGARTENGRDREISRSDSSMPREPGISISPPAPPLPVAPKLEVASFGARIGAFFLDYVALTLLTQIGILAAKIEQPPTEDMSQFMSDYMNLLTTGNFEGTLAAYFQNMVMTLFVISIILLAYYVIFHAIGGQTLGKLALGIRVTRTDGSPIGLGRSLLRYVVFWIGSKPLYLGAFWAMFNKEVATWHDYAADTRVYKVSSLDALADFKETGSSSNMRL